MQQEQYTCHRLNAPEFFADPAFIQWLNNPNANLFTWHEPGNRPGEYSDVMVTYDNGEGSNSDDMPEHIWNQLCDILGDQFAVVWLTNLAE